MAQNKVQYQRGLSMLEFFDGYGSPERCEAAVRAWRWPEGFVCPRCEGTWHSEFRRGRRLYFQCSGCRYLFFQDASSTASRLDRAHRVVAGGDYSGCQDSVFDVGGGEYYCVHTARPAGPRSDHYLSQLSNYAMQTGWRLVHSVPTRGLIHTNGCTSIYLVTRVSYTINPTPVVRTARVQLDANRPIVGCDRWEDG